MIKFNKIPFVDVWSHRGLKDIFPSLCFMAFGGENHAVSSLIWFDIFWSITYIILLYAIFTKVVRPIYACLLTLLFSQLTFNNMACYNSLILLPPLFLPWAMQQLTFYRVACIWLLSASVFLWMPSAGKASILGLWLVFCIRGLQNIKILLYKVIPAFIAVFGILGVSYFLLVFLRGWNIFDRISEIEAFTFLEFGAHTLSTIAPKISIEALSYYVIMPLFFAGICYIFAWRKLSFKTIPLVHWMYLGIASSMLFLVTRTMGRHCLVQSMLNTCIGQYELLNNQRWFIFFFLLLVLLPLIRPFKQKIFFPTWLTIPIVTVILLSGDFVILLPEALKIPLVNWKTKNLQRVHYITEYRPIVEFLQSQLKNNETFVDVTNGHGLYAYTNKENPLFLSLVNVYVTDKVQKILVQQLQEQFDKGKFPLAIVSSPFWGSNIDGLNTTMLHYHVAEFIYQHYVPYKNIHGFEVWAAKGGRFSQETSQVQVEEQVTVDIPIITQGQYFGHNANVTTNNNIIHIDYGPYRPMVQPSIINLMTATNMSPIEIAPYKVCKCELEITNVLQGTLQLSFSFDHQPYTSDSSCYLFIPSYQEKTKVQLTKILPEGAKEITDIRITAPDHTYMDIYSFSMTLLNTYPSAPLIVTQVDQHNYGPYLWANYDPYHALSNNDVLAIFTKDIKIHPSETHHIVIPSYIKDDIAEYLHFRILSPNGGYLIGNVQDTDNHSGEFRFALKESAKPIDYLLRISSQYAWKNKQQFSLTSHSTSPIHIERICAIKGD